MNVFALYPLNQTVQETVQILKRLEKCPGLRRVFLRSFQVEVEELRAETNCEVTELLNERQQRAPEPQRRVHSGYTRKKARIIPFKSA